MTTNNTCPICDRLLHAPTTEAHHLIPKTFKGKVLVDIHKVCHQKIHSTFSERELLQYYHEVQRIKEHPEMQKFIKWVAKKPPEYYTRNKDTQTRKKKRKR